MERKRLSRRKDLEIHIILFKSVYAALWVMNYYLPCEPYPADEQLLDSYSSIFYRYGIGWEKLHSLVPPAQIFTTRTLHTMFMVRNHPDSLPVSLTKTKVSKQHSVRGHRSVPCQIGPWRLLSMARHLKSMRSIQPFCKAHNSDFFSATYISELLIRCSRPDSVDSK